MGIFLSSLAVVAALLQAPPPPAAAPADSLGPWRARLLRDSGDAEAWSQLGLGLLHLSDAYHEHHGASGDTSWARAILDTADYAFTRVATLRAGSASSDSARALRVFAWADRALLDWELNGVEAATHEWKVMPADLKLAPVLEELGENLLRACPREGVLLTAGPPGTVSTWFLQFARGLRPDLLIVPLTLWETDSLFRARVIRENHLASPRSQRLSATEDPWIEHFARFRPVCAPTGFDRPPERRPAVKWTPHPLMWVAGGSARRRSAGGEGGDAVTEVPAQDFVFAALKLALDANDPWARTVLGVYRRAAGISPELCDAMTAFEIPKDKVGCP